jgi:hypothetical protein
MQWHLVRRVVGACTLSINNLAAGAAVCNVQMVCDLHCVALHMQEAMQMAIGCMEVSESTHHYADHEQHCYVRRYGCG